MLFNESFVPATLVRRYKRFLADVIMEDGSEITVHTPNTGSMQGCAEPGMRVWLRNTQNPKRKYLWSWEMSETADGVLIGVDTSLSNRLVVEGIENGTIRQLKGYSNIQREVKYGKQQSRIDILLSRDNQQCYVEVKNVTAKFGESTAIFPDAVTARGVKHLEELMEMVNEGNRAVIFFCIQRSDVDSFRSADEIDPKYGQLLRQAYEHGVEVMAYRASLSPESVVLVDEVAITL